MGEKLVLNIDLGSNFVDYLEWKKMDSTPRHLVGVILNRWGSHMRRMDCLYKPGTAIALRATEHIIRLHIFTKYCDILIS